MSYHTDEELRIVVEDDDVVTMKFSGRELLLIDEVFGGFIREWMDMSAGERPEEFEEYENIQYRFSEAYRLTSTRDE